MGGVIRKAQDAVAKTASKAAAKTEEPAASKPAEAPAEPAKAKAKAKATEPARAKSTSTGPVATPSADALAHQAETRRREEEAPPPPPPPSRPLTEAEQATVTEASTSIRTATVTDDTVNPEAGSAEVREQLEAHPELADEILAASGESLDSINEAINEPGQDQETINATVDNLAHATEQAGAYGQDRLGQTLAASGNTDHLKVALASSTATGAPRLAETTSHHLPEGARAGFRNDVATVRQAAATVQAEYGPSATYHTESPARAAAALQAQVEAHPELVSMITLASQPTLDSMASWLESHPGETESIQATTRSLSSVANTAGQDADDLLVETLAGLPPDNEGLINGIAQASLDNEVDLGSALAERHGETAGATLERATQVGNQVREIDGLLASGDLAGAYAASQLLRQYATDAPPGIATALLQGLDDMGSIGRLTGILGQTAEGADRDGYLWGFVEGTPQQAFDGVIMDLSFVATRSGDLGLTQEVGRQLAGAMNPDDIERFDEAFHNAVASGQGGDLTAAVIEELAAQGRTDQAQHVLDELDSGLHDLQHYFHEQADRRDSAFAELGYLQQQFGPLGTEAEQTAAAQAFLDRFPEIDEVERLGGVIATDLDVIDRLRESVPQLDVDDLDDNEEDMIREFPRFASTAEGSARVAEALDAQSRGHSTFLDQLTQVDLEGDDRTEFMQRSGLALDQAAMQQASAAVALRDPARADRIFAGLLRIDGAAELQGVSNAEDLEPLIAALGDVAAAGAADNPPPSAFQTAQNSLTTAVADLESRGIHLSGSPRLRLLTGGAAFLGAAGVIAGDKPDNFEEWVGALAAVGESGLEGAQVVGALRGASSATLGRFAAGSTVAGLVGAGLSAWNAVNAAEEGDYAAAGLHAGAAVGGAMVALGSTAAVTGVGAVLVVGAAAGLYQLSRVRASNVHENGNTEAYIQALIPNADPEVVRHLRNADDEGVNTGIVFQAAAERLGVDPPELFNRLSELSPDQVLELVESAHALVSGDRSEVDDLTQTHPSDGHVGEFLHQSMGDYRYYRLDDEGRITGDALTPDEEAILTAHLRGQGRIKASPRNDLLWNLPQGSSVIAPSSVQGWINYYEYLTGESLG